MMVTLVMSSVTTLIYDGDISHVQCYLYMMVILVMSSVTTPIYDGDISHVQCYHTYI